MIRGCTVCDLCSDGKFLRSGSIVDSESVEPAFLIIVLSEAAEEIIILLYRRRSSVEKLSEHHVHKNRTRTQQRVHIYVLVLYRSVLCTVSGTV